MAVFEYAGMRPDGTGIDGSIEASSEREALTELANRQVLPTRLGPAKSDATEGGGQDGASRLAAAKNVRISSALRTSLVRELATFLEADIPLLEALHSLRDQHKGTRIEPVLEEVARSVGEGDSFSDALGRYPKVFSPLIVSMVRVGEAGGTLPVVLDQTAQWIEHEDEIRNEVRDALAYPGVILTLGLATLVILLTFVLPRITSIFAGMETQLPLPTRILLGASAGAREYWWLFGGGALMAAVAARYALGTSGGRAAYDRAILRLPLVGSLLSRLALVRIARGCETLLSAGVPLLESLHVVKGVLGNSVMNDLVGRAADNITRGRPLAVALSEEPYFPKSALRLIEVGEKTGRLSEMFGRVANVVERQNQRQIKLVLSLLSPLMIVALAILVALVAMSILLPILQLNQLMR